MRIDCVSPIRPLCGIYKSAPRWRKSANDGSKTSCALPHRSRGQVSVGFHGIKSKKSKSTEKYTEGLHPERPARGAVLYTGQFRSCIEHKGPPSTKNMHTKDGHDSRGRNYKAETQLPTFAWASLPI